MNSEGRYTKGTLPLAQDPGYKGDAYYWRRIKWPLRIGYALFLLYAGHYWL